MSRAHVVSPFILLLALCGPAAAQAPDAKPSTGCTNGAKSASDSATPPTEGSNSGTSPGGAGSTGWTGGTGGSFVGTSHDNADGTKSGQPETATGLNPIDKPGNPAAAGQGEQAAQPPC